MCYSIFSSTMVKSKVQMRYTVHLYIRTRLYYIILLIRNKEINKHKETTYRPYVQSYDETTSLSNIKLYDTTEVQE